MRDCYQCGSSRCYHGNCDRCAGDCHRCADLASDFAEEIVAQMSDDDVAAFTVEGWREGVANMLSEYQKGNYSWTEPLDGITVDAVLESMQHFVKEER